MKIIGNTTNDDLLISATKTEIANLFGAHSSYCLKEIGMDEQDIKPGLTINVDATYERLSYLREHANMLRGLRGACERALRETEPLPRVFEIFLGTDTPEG